MAELATLARPYAEAIFKLAQETENFARWSETLALLSTVTQNPDFSEIAGNPRLNREVVLNLLLDICAEQWDEQAKNLVRILVDNRRLHLAPVVAKQYETLRAAHQGVVKVELISTYAVKPQQKQELIDLLQKRFAREIEVEVKVDRKLLGGWVIRTEDQVIDLSVRGRLQQLTNELMS